MALARGAPRRRLERSHRKRGLEREQSPEERDERRRYDARGDAGDSHGSAGRERLGIARNVDAERRERGKSADGKPAEGVNPIDLNEATGWKGAWENLPKYTKDGKEIAYTVQTAEIEGYTTSTKKAGTNGFEVTSTIAGTVPTPDDGGKDAGFPVLPVIAVGVVAGIAVIAGAAVYLAKSGREERN